VLFNSYEFLIFLPIVWLLYWLFPRRKGVQNALLLLASYVFYAWWDVRFVGLIACMTLVGWACGLGIRRVGAGTRRGRVVCTFGVVASLGVLGAFKYYDFFVDSLNEAMQMAGLSFCLPLWRVALPVGISFYTFQIVGYAVDVYRGRIVACRDLLAFATFVSFFPQLVAGPIERAGDLLPQMECGRRACYPLMADGARQMLWGFVKKMLLADRCAPLVAAIYNNPQSDGTDLWAGTVLFAFQIYGDFSGYSDIAIGAGKLFGIRLTRNFKLPYFSCNVAEFWRRWHVTLMSWFRDYIYIPLGGSRRGRLITLRNTAIVFLASGLWHGAAWTFVAWGAYFALWSGLHILVVSSKSSKEGFSNIEGGKTAAGRSAVPLPLGCVRAGHALKCIATFLIVCVGWVFFRSESIACAFMRLGEMFTHLVPHSPYGGFRPWLVPLFVMGAEWISRDRGHALDFPVSGILRYRAVRWLIYYTLLFSVLYWGGVQTAFIYFQF